MSRSLHWATFLVMVAGASHALAQLYPFIAVPGAPKGTTLLFQDSLGRLWLGGADVACFDGSRFFFLHDYGPIAGNTRDIAEDAGGAIWIGTEAGLYRFADGHVDQILKGDALSVIPVSAQLALAAVGPTGQRGGSGTPLIRIQRTRDGWVTDQVMSLKGSVGPLTRDSSGMLLYPVPNYGWAEVRLADVMHWKRGMQIRVINHPDAGLGSGRLRVLRNRAGCVWTGNEAANAYDCGQGQQPVPSRGLPLRGNMHETPDGRMITSGNAVLTLGNSGNFQVASAVNGLEPTRDAIVGRDGTAWFVNPQGLYRFSSPFTLEYWTPREGLDAPPLSVTRSGRDVYAGLNNRIAILTEDRNRWETSALLTGAGVSALLPIGKGSLIAKSDYAGPMEFRAAGRKLVKVADGPRALPGMRLTKTPEGEVWLAGRDLGQLKQAGRQLVFQQHPLKTYGGFLSVKYEEHRHRLFACYNGGLVTRDEHGVWSELSIADGLVNNMCWSLAPLSNGDIWYAYFSFPGFALIRPNSGGKPFIRQYRQSDGVEDAQTDSMEADRVGRIWRSGSVGIYAADDREAEAGQWLKLDSSDGFPANVMNSGSFFADQDGSLWWGADNDLVHFTPPPDFVRPRFAPQIFVSAFSWDSNAPRMAEAVTNLPHGSKITAHIGSLQFDRRNALRVRYRLLPGQPAWRESKNLDLPLGALSAGKHTIEVQGRVFTGPWSDTVRRSFTVLRPALLAWPWLAVYAFMAGGLAGGGYWLHRRRQDDASALLPDLASWRMGALLPEVHSLAGTLLDDRFEVGDLLARGGFANVFSGYDRCQQQRCAVKVFRRELRSAQPGANAWIQRGFEREVAVLQKVRHPHIVSIYAHGIAPTSSPYLVMEFVEGRNLRELLESGPLSPRRVARLLGQLAGALDAIHAQDIYHRDVKPENIIIRHEGSPAEESVLIDFSIAIVKDADETLHGLSRAAGSFDYMAPEQAMGCAGPSSDIFSLAKVAIEMLTGRRLKELLPDASLDLPDRLRQLAGGFAALLSAESIEILATALEFDPAKRPRAAGQFAAPLMRDLEL